jgi:hypothetical protein
MKRALSNIILALCFLLVSVFPTQSFAVLEERNDPFWGTGAITYDTETGLEWLDVYLSTDLSCSDVSTQFGQGGEFEGFRYATHQEVLDFLDAAGISIIDHGSSDPAHVTACQNFIELVGPTDIYNDRPTIQGMNGTIHPNLSDYRMSALVYADPPRGDVRHIVYTQTYYRDSYSSPAFGHWLVREALVDPEVKLKQLFESIILLNTKHGILNSFDAKYSSALKALDDLYEYNGVAATNTLNALINAVEAQSGKTIKETEAHELISKVQAIIDLLSH